MNKDLLKSKKQQSSEHTIEKNDSIFDWLPPKEPKNYDFKHNLIQISRDLIQEKYFEAFNFYFSKPINEILANLSIPHVILYKDYLYYDDYTEYLKRYYTYEESKPRIHNLSDFYFKATYGLARPNLAIHEQNKIILKRNNKLHKYYLAKIQNMEEIPQTHRDHNQQGAVPERRILDILHDESESSWNGGGEEEDAPREGGGNYQNILDDGEVHNSFQQMLERYENLTANVSYDSVVHDIYNPDYSSSSSPSREDFQANGFLSHKPQSNQKKRLETPLQEKSLSITTSIDRSGNKRNIGTDKFPDEYSDFGFSDASDLFTINEMLQNDEKRKVHEERNKDKKMLDDRKFSKERVPSEREINKLPSTQESHPKRKPTSKASSRSSTSFTKKNEQPSSEKRKSGYEDIDIPNERPSKDKHSEPRRPDSKPDKMLTREDLAGNYEAKSKTLPSTHSPKHSSDYMTTQVSQQYKSVKPFDIPKKQLSIPLKKLEVDKKRYPSATQKSQPHTARTPMTEDYARDGIDSMDSLHKPKNSIQYIKELVQKYQKNSDDFAHGKSKVLLDEFKKSSMYAKLTGMNEKAVDRQQMIKDIYSNNDSLKPKKVEGKTSFLTRSKTEDALLKNISQAANKSKKLNMSPAKVDTHVRGVMSPSNIRKEKPGYRYVSNEGISLGHVSSHSHANFITHISTENSKLIADHNLEERFISGSGNFKTLKVDKVADLKKNDYKPPLKPTIASNNSNNNSKAPISRRLTATNPGSLTNSAQKSNSTTSGNGHAVNSMPVSPTRKFNFNLNFSKLNQQVPRQAEENATENSYGFWTSRSTKGGVEEQRPSGSKDYGMITDDRYRNQDRDYFIRQNYNPQEDKKKDRNVKTSSSLTRSHPNLEFNFRENGIVQTIKSNQQAFKTGLSGQGQPISHESKKPSIGSKGEIVSNPTRYSKGLYKK